MAVRMTTPNDANPSEPSRAAPTAGDAAVILCADEVLRGALTFWFGSLPLRAQVATDGYHANRLLQAGGCRLLLTDRVLPPWPGLDTFRSLRARAPALRIAFVDRGSRDDLSLARLTGATDILAMPLTRQAVADTVGRIVRVA